MNRLLHDELVDEQKIAKEASAILAKYESYVMNSESKQRKMKKEWSNAEVARSRGGSRKWPVWVVQLICELLVNGTPPSAIPGNIQIMYETLHGEEAEDLPSVSFVQSCRVVVEVIGETVTAIKLAKANTWRQLGTDATTRQRIPFTAIIIGLLGDDAKIDLVVVSSCMFMKGEKSATGAQGIIDKVSVLSDYDCIMFIHM